MRVVVDTNVLVSALTRPGGVPSRVYDLAAQRRYRLIVSAALLTELARILSTRFGWTPGGIEHVLQQLLRIGVYVEPGETVSFVAADPDDDRVLEAALAGGADLIASGDRHLLDLLSWRGIEIVTPRELMARLAADDPPPGA